jgi:hypothetical protein
VEAVAVVETVTPPAVVLEGSVVISDEALDSLIDNLADVPARRVLRMRQNTTKSEVAALIASIETFGLSRALLAFANHDGALRASVPSIPALESMAADLTVEGSAAVLEALKAIKLDVNDEAGEEELRGAFQWFTTIMGFLGGLFPGIVLYAVYTVWNDYRDEIAARRRGDDKRGAAAKDEKIASVVPYNTIVGYLGDLVEVPVVLKSVLSIPLPKTDEEYTKFLEQIERRLAPLGKLGVHVSKTGHLTGSDLATAVHGDIRKIGYTEDSLKHIAELAKHGEVVETELHALLKSLQELPADGDKIAGRAVTLLEDIVHTTLIRMTKILHLVKHTCQSIEHFYKKAD